MSIAVQDRDFLTIRETAQSLSVSEKTVLRLIGAVILPAVRVSAGAIRVERVELDDWLEQ